MAVDFSGLLDGGKESLFDASGLADIVGHVDGEEVGRVDETVYICKVDVVCIHEVLPLVVQGLHGCIGFAAGLDGLGAHYLMLTVALVPHGHEVHAEALLGLYEGLELVDAFVCETVADA